MERPNLQSSKLENLVLLIKLSNKPNLFDKNLNLFYDKASVNIKNIPSEKNLLEYISICDLLINKEDAFKKRKLVSKASLSYPKRWFLS